jgi:hypothetical protein
MTVIVPARPAEPSEIPKAAQRLADAANAHGWDVAVTYAHAEFTDRKVPTIESVAVRMWREGRLYGVWINGKFTSGGSQSHPHGARELMRIVRMTRLELAEWLEGVKAA